MASIMLTVFILQLCIHLVNTFGAATFNSLLWNLYNLFPTSTSKSTAEQRDLKKQFMKLRLEMNATSSQDNFAKWAKIRRQHDKVLEQLEKSKASSDSRKAKFDSAISTIRWTSTNGFMLFLQFWHMKQPMFWIPQGFVPYYAEWLISSPAAPLGSVSIMMWSMACARVISLVSEAVVALIALTTEFGATSQKYKDEPMKVPSEAEGKYNKKGQ